MAGDLENLSDDELIRAMQQAKDEDPLRYARLVAELYRRHQEYLLAATRRLRMPPGHSREDLAQETLIRFSDRVMSYEVEDLDRDRSRRRLRAFLGKIALRIWMRWWRNAGGADGPRLEVRLDPNGEPPAGRSAATRLDAGEDSAPLWCGGWGPILNEARARLSEKDRDLLDDYRWYDRAKRCVDIPRDVLHALAIRRGYIDEHTGKPTERTLNSMAQARKRAVKRLREHLIDLREREDSGEDAR